jgi:replication factor A1
MTQDATVNMDQDKPVNFQTTATVLYIKPENLTYQACPKCNKKVARPSATDLLHADLMCQVVEDNGAYSCAKCGKNHDHFNYRMLGSMSLGDHTGSQWMQMFQVGL